MLMCANTKKINERYTVSTLNWPHMFPAADKEKEVF
jgi:hypothetical protein